jgi:RNA polymerase sigma-70 factor (ECF subfamily)
LTPLRHVPADEAIDGFLRDPREDSFVSVFRKLYAPLCRYFIARGIDSSTAEELVQDVLLTVYRRAGELRSQVCFTGWLFRVARNCLLQHARKRRVAAESLTEDFDEGALRYSSTFRIPEESELFEWMQVLEDDEREICLMRYLDDLDYQSISDALQIPLGTVKWKLHQVKKKIAARLAVSTRGRKP